MTGIKSFPGAVQAPLGVAAEVEIVASTGPDHKGEQNTGGSDGGDGSSSGQDDDLHDDPIIARLRAAYDEVAAEPLPDELLALLEKLDEAERNR